MRRLSTFFSVLATSVIFSAMPLVAADTMGHEEQKDDCLLVSKNCANSVDSIMKRIERLEKEIAKGSAVYSSEELMILNRKMHDANEMLNTLQFGS